MLETIGRNSTFFYVDCGGDKGSLSYATVFVRTHKSKSSRRMFVFFFFLFIKKLSSPPPLPSNDLRVI